MSHWLEDIKLTTGERIGVFVWHNISDTKRCAKVIMFGKWKVVSHKPLTIEGIITCDCGISGRIIKDKWHEY